VQHFSILERSVLIWELLQSGVSLWLLGSRHQSHFVHFEHWLEKITTAVVENTLELIVAWVIPETIVVKVGLVDLDRASLIAHHEFLELEEAQIPTITFFIGHELRNGRWGLEHWTNFELPNAAVDVSVTVERSPVLEMLWLVGGHWHLSNICDHVLIVDGIINELRFVMGVEQIQQFALLPDGVSSKEVIGFILIPVDVSDREIVILGHLKWPLGFDTGWRFSFLFDTTVEVVDHGIKDGCHF
jgi:hypothetical protein